MKKLISMALAYIMVLCLSMTAFAADTPAKNSSTINETEAMEIARWFIANDIYENGNNGWSESTVIENVDEDSGYYGNSYIIRLTANGQNNGYIVLGTTVSDVLIKEFAYDGEPLFVGLMPVSDSPLGVSDDNGLSVDNTAENLPYLQKIRSHPTPYTSDKDYGGITDPYKHVNETYGSGWTLKSNSTISGFTLLNMKNFDTKQHCTLTTLTAIFNYHRDNGYPKIDSDLNKLFNQIKTIATDKKYYNPDKNGTDPTKIDNLTTDIWSHYGYSGSGNNDFFFADTAAVNKTLKKEVDGNRPGAISFSSGYYGNHTVTYYGYKFYEKSGQQDKMYLQVNDNWGTSARYVDTTYIGSLGHTFFEICRVLP